MQTQPRFFQSWMCGVAAVSAAAIAFSVSATAYNRSPSHPTAVDSASNDFMESRCGPAWIFRSCSAMPPQEIRRFARRVDPLERASIINHVTKIAREEGVPVNVALAVGIQESGLRPADRVTGPRTGRVGGYQRAVGTYQILPSTGRLHGCGNLRNTQENIRCGMRILGRAIRSNGGDVGLAVREYHGGPNRRYWGRNNAAYHQAVLSRAGLRYNTRSQAYFASYSMSATGSTPGRTTPVPVDQYPHTW